MHPADVVVSFSQSLKYGDHDHRWDVAPLVLARSVKPARYLRFT
jgi:hypothetical protein